MLDEEGVGKVQPGAPDSRGAARRLRAAGRSGKRRRGADEAAEKEGAQSANPVAAKRHKWTIKDGDTEIRRRPRGACHKPYVSAGERGASGPVIPAITNSDPNIRARISLPVQCSWLIPRASELLIECRAMHG